MPREVSLNYTLFHEQQTCSNLFVYNKKNAEEMAKDIK